MRMLEKLRMIRDGSGGHEENIVPRPFGGLLAVSRSHQNRGYFEAGRFKRNIAERPGRMLTIK